MAAIEYTRTAPFGAITIYRVVELASEATMAFSRWNTTRKTRVALSRLSDDVLRDIGLERGDIARF